MGLPMLNIQVDLQHILEERYDFRPFRRDDRALVEQYGGDSIFFDLSFTNFWAWEHMFHYRMRIIGDTLAVTYITLDQVPAAILLPGPSRTIRPAVEVVREAFGRVGCPAIFEYVPEAWLPLYQAVGLPMEVTSDRDWSDYVYQVADFTNLEGGENKSKRRELRLVEALGAVTFRPLTEDLFDNMLKVFQCWCDWHDCEQCFFGCEQKAFARLREVWDLQRYYGGLVYLEGEPVAFALGETLGGCACYSFQKNRENFRGLTFYLSYHCAMLPGHPPLLNWCEDMGLEGLRLNKLRYRPSEIVSKYTVKFPSGWDEPKGMGM